MRRAALMFAAAIAGCGGPALQNVPKPDTDVAAGVAAGAAGLATLAKEAAGGQQPEKKKPEQDKRPVKVKERVTPGVLDRLDSAEAKRDGTAPSDPNAAPAETPALDSRLPPPKKP